RLFKGGQIMAFGFSTARSLGVVAGLVIVTCAAVGIAQEKMADPMKRGDDCMKKCDEMMGVCDKMAGMKGDKPLSGMPMMMCHACDECCTAARDIIAGCAEHLDKDAHMTKA